MSEKISDLNSQIKEDQEKLKDLLEELERIRCRFIDKAVAYIPDLIKREAEDYITRHPDVVERVRRELGQDGLAMLKRAVEKLAGNSPELLRSILDSKEYWPHLTETWVEFESFGRHAAPGDGAILDHAIRSVLSRLGDTFNSHRVFGREKPDFPWEYDHTNGRFRYSIGYEWSSGMDAATGEYNKIYRQVVGLKREMEEKIQKREGLEAKRLWDQA